MRYLLALSNFFQAKKNASASGQTDESTTRIIKNNQSSNIDIVCGW